MSFNGSSAYGGGVTGSDKPPVPGLVRWIFPAGVWRMRP